MSAAPGREHWLDRLAVRQSRRQLLRSALAGAVLTVPFASSASAAGVADPHACRKGCFYTSFQKAGVAFQRCGDIAGQQFSAYGFTVALAFIPSVAGLTLGAGGTLLCRQVAEMQQKAMQYACLQPDCPGFDPKAPGGPCEICQSSGGICCPDQNVVSGYSCCTAAPGGCCKDDGCHSGTTDCGGG
jgi:hypothetical protein